MEMFLPVLSIQDSSSRRSADIPSTFQAALPFATAARFKLSCSSNADLHSNVLSTSASSSVIASNLLGNPRKNPETLIPAHVGVVDTGAARPVWFLPPRSG